MRRVLLALAASLLAIWICEYFFDLGVLVALILASVAVFLKEEWTPIAIILPAVGWFAADAQWRAVTIILYTVFATIAFFRKRLVAATVALVIAFVEFHRL